MGVGNTWAPFGSGTAAASAPTRAALSLVKIPFAEDGLVLFCAEAGFQQPYYFSLNSGLAINGTTVLATTIGGNSRWVAAATGASIPGISAVLGDVCFLTLASQAYLCAIAEDPNTSGLVNPGVGGGFRMAPATETAFRWIPPFATISDWLDWGYTGVQRAVGHISFGAEADVCQSGALRFPSVIDQRTMLMGSKSPAGNVQSVLNISSGPLGVSQSLEVGREFWEQLLLYASTNVIYVLQDTAGFGGYLWEIEGYGHQLRLVPNVLAGIMYWLWGDRINLAITQCTVRAGKGTTLLFQAGESSAANGGDIEQRTGWNSSGGATLSGAYRVTFGQGATVENMFEALELVAGQRILSLVNGTNAGTTTTEMPVGTGDLVVYIGNANALPGVNPVGGGILYVNAGALTYRGPAGTVTPLAVA